MSEELYKSKYNKLCNNLRCNKLEYLILDVNDPKFKELDKKYEVKYKNLVSRLKQRGWKTVEVSSNQLKDYAGTNPEWGELTGYPIKDKEFHIDKDMSNYTKYITLNHEVEETKDMEKGMSYWDAHKKALRNESKVGGIP